jgi:hypothetical protein
VPQLTEHVEEIDLTSHRPRRKREIVEDDDDVVLLGSSRPLISPARPQVRRRIEPAVVTVVEDDDPPLREISAGDAGECCGDCPTCGQSKGRLRGLGSKVLKPAVMANLLSKAQRSISISLTYRYLNRVLTDVKSS